MRTLVLASPLLAVLLLTPTSTSADGLDLTTVSVHFEMPPADIAGIASLRGSCDVLATGENVSLRSGEVLRTTIGAEAGPCAMVLSLFGVDVPLPVSTTPLGRSSFYLPGLATVTLGIIDLSLDLVTGLNSTTTSANPAAAEAYPRNVTWPSWGATRILLNATTGYGDVLETRLTTTFTYTVSLALTVYALSIVLYQVGLTSLGAYPGSLALDTALTLDLVPHPPTIDVPTGITDDGANLSWSLAGDSDLDHLEVWADDGTYNVSYQIADPAATAFRVPLEPETTYRVWVVAVDGAGQSSASGAVTVRTSAEPAPEEPSSPLAPESLDGLTWALVGFAIAGTVLGYLVGVLRGRKFD